jgi:hypothetical protein
MNVVLPVANTALRAQHAGDTGQAAVAAVRAARNDLSRRDLLALLLSGRTRSALALSVLKTSPALYSRLLRSR